MKKLSPERLQTRAEAQRALNVVVYEADEAIRFSLYHHWGRATNHAVKAAKALAKATCLLDSLGGSK